MTWKIDIVEGLDASLGTKVSRLNSNILSVNFKKLASICTIFDGM